MDPYALCPCGSKKKIKFCCHALVGEMEKVLRLQENNQPRMALQLLEKLDKTHPENPWVITRTAMLLLSEGRSAEAEAMLRAFLRKHQDHAFANVLYGIAAYGAAGYPEAKRAVHRAFRFGGGEYQEFIASLATDVGIGALHRGQYLATRSHLALALRWSDAEQRKGTFAAIYEFDGNQGIPLPFRGPHPLPSWTPPAELQDAVNRAQQLATIGCWHEAADHLAGAAGPWAGAPELLHTIGLYRAWDGADEAAAAALHQAAAAYGDFETAVECETLAQLLDRRAPDRRVSYQAIRFPVISVSRLLTQLDACPRLSRIELTPEDLEAAGGQMTARYVVLDRERQPPGSPLSLSTIPRTVGTIAIFTGSGDAEDAAFAMLTVPVGAQADAAAELFTTAAGDAAGPQSVAVPLPDTVVANEFGDPLYFDDDARNADVARILAEEWDMVVGQTWPQTPQPALGGRTPRDAAGVPELRVALAAAIHVLDTACARRGTIIDVAALRAEYQLPPIATIRADAATNVSMLSFAQSMRIELSSLTPQQLEQVTQRALLMRHPGFAHAVLTHVIEHGDPSDTDRRQAFYLVLSQICDDAYRSDEALRWIARGLASVADGPHRFEQVARWKMRELTTRTNLEPGPELNGLLTELWHSFSPKLPGLREMLAQTAQSLGIEPPWESAIVTASNLSAATSGEWAPVGAGAAGGGEKKLWLPGDR